MRLLPNGTPVRIHPQNGLESGGEFAVLDSDVTSGRIIWRMASWRIHEFAKKNGVTDWGDLADYVHEIGGASHPTTSWRNRRLNDARLKIASRRKALAGRESIERFTGGDAALKEALEIVARERSTHPSHPSAAGFHAYFFRALQHAS